MRNYFVLLSQPLVHTSVLMLSIPCSIRVNGSSQCDQELLVDRHEVLLRLYFQGSTVLSGMTATSHRWLFKGNSFKQKLQSLRHTGQISCAQSYCTGQEDPELLKHCRKSCWTALTQEGTESTAMLIKQEGRQGREGVGQTVA